MPARHDVPTTGSPVRRARSRWTVRVLCILLGGWAAVGCVPLEKYERLHARYEQQEHELRKAEKQLEQTTARERILTSKVEEREKTVGLLRAQLRQAREEAQDRAEQMAAQPKEEEPKVAQKPTAPEGFQVNPQTGGIILENGILFAEGSSELKPEGKKTLKRLAQTLDKKEYRNHHIRIDGHTDHLPITRSNHQDNWELAGKRARNVLNFLESCGISANRMFFAGFASHRPLVEGTESDQLEKNRRVEIVLFEG